MRLSVIELSRHFGPLKAVDQVSFTLEPGEIYGFVGPNGAGKTTTMRILATLDEPTGGDVFLDDISIIEQPELARQHVGYVPDSLPSPRGITVHDFLDFFARAYGLHGAHRQQTVQEIEEFTNLLGLREKMVADLSKGMKQRVSLARALVHEPRILVMDEPAAGLDPRARVELRELLRVLAEQGRSILISSHILSELSEICHGAVILERGTIVRAGSIQGLTQAGLPHREVHIRVLDDAEQLLHKLLAAPGIETARLDGGGQQGAESGGKVVAHVTGSEDDCVDLLGRLVAEGHRVIEFHQRRADLEEIFMSLTRGEVQ